jgi:hypothetical protein
VIRNWIAALPPGPQRWLLLVVLLAYPYGLALTVLRFVSAGAAGAWVAPSLPVIQELLPLASVILAGHAAQGDPVPGMVNAHLLAVGHVSGLALGMLCIARVLANPAKAALNFRHSVATSPQAWARRVRPWAMALFCLVFGLAVLWSLSLDTGGLRADGGFKFRASAGLPGLMLVFFAQGAWFMLAGVVAMLLVWIKCGRSAMSGPSAGPPAGI